MKNFIEIGKTEEEQVEQLKKWFKENGTGIVAGTLIGFGGIVGWDYYQDQQYAQSVEARGVYLTLVSNPDKAQLFNESLQGDYSDSIYAQYADLILAKNAVSNKDYPKALSYLQPLFDDENTVLANIARLRAGSIYLQTGDYDKALSILEAPSDGFLALYSQLKGDVYLAQKNIRAAKEYYQLAIDKLSAKSKLKQLILTKLNDLQ